MSPAGTHRADRIPAHTSDQGNAEEGPAGRSRRPARTRLPRGETPTEGPLTVDGMIDEFRDLVTTSQAYLRKVERQVANQPGASELLRVAKETAHGYDQVLADLEKLRALLKKPAPKKESR